MAYKYNHLYSGNFRIFEEEISRSIWGSSPSGAHDLYILPNDVDYVIADSGLFNASAEKSSSGSAIYTFFLGLHLSIADTVCSLACSEGFYKDVPFDMAVAETHSDDMPNRYIDYSSLFFNNQFRGLVPRKYLAGDPARIDESSRGRLGNHLMEMCLRFVSYHEQAHFLLGHIDLAMRDFGIKRLYEVQPKQEEIGRINDYEVSRLLEIHADMNAVQLMFDTHPATDRFAETKRGLWYHSAKNPIVWVKCILLSVAIVTSIIHKAEMFWISDVSKRTHPFSISRFLVALNLAEDFLQNLLPEAESRDEFYRDIISDINFIYSFFGFDSYFINEPGKGSGCDNELVNQELKLFEDSLLDVVSYLKTVRKSD